MPAREMNSATGGVDRWGIQDAYRDTTGAWRRTTPATRSAIRAAIGPIPQPPAGPDVDAVRVVTARTRVSIPAHGELRLEDGSMLGVTRRLPPDLPLGYHSLYLSGRREPQLIIVRPPQGCYLPDDLDAWGWSVQLYALRSARSWGIGDLADLGRFAKWSAARTTAKLLLINPLCAATPGLPQQASPYYPSSRLFRNPLYLSVEAIPGAAKDSRAINRLATAARALNERRIIDRDAAFTLKMAALERRWKQFHPTPGFERYRAGQGGHSDDLRHILRPGRALRNQLARLARSIPSTGLGGRKTLFRRIGRSRRISPMASMAA